MTQRDGHSDGRFRRFRIKLPRDPGHFRRRNDLHDHSHGLSFQNYGAIRHLHLARDVQIVAGIGLRQVPTSLGQGCERRHCK